MKRKHGRHLAIFVFLILLIGLPTWWVNLQILHERDNAALIAAIKANNPKTALQALERRADPNARDLGDDSRPGIERFHQLWNRFAAGKRTEVDATKATALQVLFCTCIPTAQAYDSNYKRPENVSILRALLEHGANPDMLYWLEQTPLHYAARWGYVRSVRLLLKYGADVRATDCFGQTPLSLAAEEDNTKIARLLLDAGADPNTEDGWGRTPLSMAIVRRNTLLIHLLREHGAH